MGTYTGYRYNEVNFHAYTGHSESSKWLSIVVTSRMPGNCVQADAMLLVRVLIIIYNDH